MVGINPSIKYQKLNFGAYDTDSGYSMAAIPGEISNDPYSERRSFLPKLNLPQKNLMPEYDYYQNPTTKSNQNSQKTSLLKPLLVLGGLTAGGIVLFKKRKNITNFFKGLFNKDAKGASAILGKTSKTGFQSGPNRISTPTFNKYYNEATTKAYITEDLDTLKLEDIQVIMSSKVNTVADKKKQLENLYELSKIYNYKDRQAKVILMMPESIQDEANTIATMFAKNRIGEVNNKFIEKIEGFKLLNTKSALANQHDIIVESQVSRGINAKDIEDIATKRLRDAKDFFRSFI